jgi:hypothetical protein
VGQGQRRVVSGGERRGRQAGGGVIFNSAPHIHPPSKKFTHLRAEAQHGDHGEAPVLQLLHLELSKGVGVVGQAKGVKGLACREGEKEGQGTGEQGATAAAEGKAASEARTSAPTAPTALAHRGTGRPGPRRRGRR